MSGYDEEGFSAGAFTTLLRRDENSDPGFTPFMCAAKQGPVHPRLGSHGYFVSVHGCLVQGQLAVMSSTQDTCCASMPTSRFKGPSRQSRSFKLVAVPWPALHRSIRRPSLTGSQHQICLNPGHSLEDLLEMKSWERAKSYASWLILGLCCPQIASGVFWNQHLASWGMAVPGLVGLLLGCEVRCGSAGWQAWMCGIRGDFERFRMIQACVGHCRCLPCSQFRPRLGGKPSQQVPVQLWAGGATLFGIEAKIDIL